MAKAATVKEAYQFFEFRVPLRFCKRYLPIEKEVALDGARSPEFYVDPVGIHHDELSAPRQRIKEQLELEPPETYPKFFLAGHTGGGKSTELGKLASELAADGRSTPCTSPSRTMCSTLRT